MSDAIEQPTGPESAGGDGSADVDGPAGGDGPARLSAGVALLAAAVATLFGGATGTALVSGLVGTALVAVGLGRRSRVAVSVGAVGLFGGVLLSGVAGAPAGRLLVAAVATLLAWDAAENAVDVGGFLGLAARTRDAELVHLAGTGGVAAASAAGGYLVLERGVTGSPLALGLLLAGAVLLLAGLRA